MIQDEKSFERPETYDSYSDDDAIEDNNMLYDESQDLDEYLSSNEKRPSYEHALSAKKRQANSGKFCLLL